MSSRGKGARVEGGPDEPPPGECPLCRARLERPAEGGPRLAVLARHFETSCPATQITRFPRSPRA